ncbi:MAG: hypothetical protein M1823_008877, partial [Watsoniomyces obsoletus]
MGMAACKSPGLSQAVAKATAKELACLGVNFILGPALDVLSDVRVQPLGVRSAGHVRADIALAFHLHGAQAGLRIARHALEPAPHLERPGLEQAIEPVGERKHDDQHREVECK